MEEKTYNINEAIIAQKKYCKENKLPDFTPLSGNYWKCKRNIYSEGGVSVEQASNSLIIGCPFCYRSYCD